MRHNVATPLGFAELVVPVETFSSYKNKESKMHETESHIPAGLRDWVDEKIARQISDFSRPRFYGLMTALTETSLYGMSENPFAESCNSPHAST